MLQAQGLFLQQLQQSTNKINSAGCSPSMNVTKLKKATATTIISRPETSHGVIPSFHKPLFNSSPSSGLGYDKLKSGLYVGRSSDDYSHKVLPPKVIKFHAFLGELLTEFWVMWCYKDSYLLKCYVLLSVTGDDDFVAKEWSEDWAARSFSLSMTLYSYKLVRFFWISDISISEPALNSAMEKQQINMCTEQSEVTWANKHNPHQRFCRITSVASPISIRQYKVFQ